jgi:hypothetical protein
MCSAMALLSTAACMSNLSSIQFLTCMPGCSCTQLRHPSITAGSRWQRPVLLRLSSVLPGQIHSCKHPTNAARCCRLADVRLLQRCAQAACAPFAATAAQFKSPVTANAGRCAGAANGYCLRWRGRHASGGQLQKTSSLLHDYGHQSSAAGSCCTARLSRPVGYPA